MTITFAGVDYIPSKQLHVVPSDYWLHVLATTPASIYYKALLNSTLTTLDSTDNDAVYLYTPLDLCNGNARMVYLSKVCIGIPRFLVVQINNSTYSTFFYLSYACISICKITM